MSQPIERIQACVATGPSLPEGTGACLHPASNPAIAMARVLSDCLALPFDIAREQYAKSVRAGLVERSLIASARFERAIAALERFALGCMARRY